MNYFNLLLNVLKSEILLSFEIIYCAGNYAIVCEVIEKSINIEDNSNFAQNIS